MIRDSYLKQIVELLDNIRFSGENGLDNTSYTESMELLTRQFEKIRADKGRVFFIGNGGSAAIASHMTADFMKNGDMRTYSLYDNAVLTCLGNDYGYEHVFSKQLESLIEEGDLLVCISSSGNSENIIRAIKTAKEHGAYVITFTGFDADNKARAMGNFNVHVPVRQYGMVESIHNMMLQQIVDMLHENKK